eukprot:m.25876 g.25876  ORF g.25876 m.25876 type:complete len:181 (+) comp28993_c0_seq1:327-869(+)
MNAFQIYCIDRVLDEAFTYQKKAFNRPSLASDDPRTWLLSETATSALISDLSDCVLTANKMQSLEWLQRIVSGHKNCVSTSKSGLRNEKGFEAWIEKESKETSFGDDYKKLLLEFAYNDVNVFWKQMGIFLDFDMVELDAMEKDHQNHHLGPKDMARKMLSKYSQEKGQEQASIENYKKF